MNENKKILIISHISEGYAPTFPFEKFIKKKTRSTSTIYHPLIESTTVQKSSLKKNGIKLKTIQYKNVNLITYIFHFLLNIIWGFKLEKQDIIFGLNNLNTLSGIILKLFKKTKIVVYYSVDYSKHRFSNKIINRIYLHLDNFCAKHSDYTLSVSDRIRQIRKSQNISDNINLLQNNGVHTDMIKKHERIYNKIKIIYTGHLTKSKGIDTIIKSLYKLPNKDEIILDIIGDGPYKSSLLKLIKSLNLQKQINLLGKMTNKKVLKIIGKYHIGIATYTDQDDFNLYCDPVKIREYMAAKCAILTSNVPYIYKLIEEHSLGYITDNSAISVLSCMKKITSIKNLKRIHDNYNQLNIELDWDKLFEKNFRIIIGDINE